MDYSKLVEFNEKNQADGTIAVIDVPMEEASRFGILNTQKDSDVITEFVEKPAKPESNELNLASDRASADFDPGGQAVRMIGIASHDQRFVIGGKLAECNKAEAEGNAAHILTKGNG